MVVDRNENYWFYRGRMAYGRGPQWELLVLPVIVLSNKVIIIIIICLKFEESEIYCGMEKLIYKFIIKFCIQYIQLFRFGK